MLKKFISIFFTPLAIGFILFFLGIFFLFIKNYKKAKIFLLISFTWLFLIGYSPFSNYLIQPFENKYKAYLDIDPTIKYVLVLGHSHVTNENISSVSQLSATALMRLNEGIRIYKKLDNAKLIVSGYKGLDIKTPHAIISKNAAISLGVPSEDILTLEKAKDTIDEASLVKKITKDEKFVLVTSAFHMLRAMKIFQSLHLNPIAAPTDFLSKEDGSYRREPRGKEIRKTELVIHEFIGTFWYFLLEKLRFLTN